MKAENLQRMRAHGLPVPPFAVVTDDTPLRLDFSGAERFAVRSTFAEEDSARHSFAGQFDTILNVPRVFLPLVLKGCVDWAKENNVTLITEEHMKIINDKRSKEKNAKK